MRFNRLDLNLLVALDALLTEQNITRASERVHLSQSAMSGALARLREHFQDDLLVQVGRRMARTALGESLARPVRELLLQVQATVERRPVFDPATASRQFALMVSDYLVTVLISRALERAAVLAPNVTFELLAPEASLQEELERGEVDFILVPRQYASPDHPLLPLLEETYACVVWKDNPAVGETVDFDRFLKMGHVAVRLGRARIPAFDEWFFARFGFVRRIEVFATTFNAVPDLIVGTQRMAMMHRRLAEHFAKTLPIRVLPPPIEIPALTEVLQWNRAQDADPGVIWFRELLLQTAKELPQP